MITTSLYLDTRRTAPGQEAPVCLVLRHRHQTSYIVLKVKVLPSQWQKGKVVCHENAKMYNLFLQSIKNKADQIILSLAMNGEISSLTFAQIADMVKQELNPADKSRLQDEAAEKARKRRLFAPFARQYCEKKNNPGTKGLYEATIKKMAEYADAICEDFDSLLFEDIDKRWLEGYERFWLSRQQQNTVNIDLRNIRAIFNEAIEQERTTFYPFRKLKIRQEQTRDKSIPAEDITRLWQYQDTIFSEREYIDMWMLMFCLIGINPVDLAKAKKTQVIHGRLEYKRTKTGKLYSILIQPEAADIISKYHGTRKNNLVNIMDDATEYKNYFNRMGKKLRNVGKGYEDGKRRSGCPICPDICPGSARTSWATIAQELDIPAETIAAALGHSTVDVTSTYKRHDMRKKVDEANRKVLDYVMNGKR